MGVTEDAPDGLVFAGTRDPDGGPTEILIAPPELDATLDDEAGEPGRRAAARRDMPALTLVSLNALTAATAEFTRSFLEKFDGAEISCGRGTSNTIVLEDARVSTHHFSVHVSLAVAAKAAISGMELQDVSSNGTWLNDRLVGKGCRVPLTAGDCIFILPSTKVGQQSAIGFAVALPLATPDAMKPRPLPRGEPARGVSATAHAEELAASMRCRQCGEAPVHKCATAVPCGHNFDLGCLLARRRNWLDCPVCHAPLRQIVRNHGVDNMVQTLLVSRPEAARGARTLKLLRASEEDRDNAMLLVRLLQGNPVLATKPLKEVPPPAELPLDSWGRPLPPHLMHLAPFAAALVDPAPQPESSGGRRSTICVLS
mmetsp:Transcript_95648/g.270695  ORF Transcript_95648/g.270695 Transcript_95648/m.270695 type:complete len:370 (-) Transcript_95648:130-1239(-)